MFRKRIICTLIGLGLLLWSAPRASAVKIADITRIYGHRTNLMTGLGLVYGLKGTGDGGGFSAAINPLRQMLAKFADPVDVTDLSNAQNVALVALTATVPANGAREGDHIDVHITSLGAATSLKGGRLFVTPMQGPTAGGPVLALAEGGVDLEDPSTPTAGIVHAEAGGAVMEENLPARSIDDDGRFTLIIDEPSASWSTASAIAEVINESESSNGELLAVAADQKNVIVTIPQNERDRPDAFISRVLRLPVKLVPSEARVEINPQTGTIIITGDVEISPVVISHKGLSITDDRAAAGSNARTPVATSKNLVALDTLNEGARNCRT